MLLYQIITGDPSFINGAAPLRSTNSFGEHDPASWSRSELEQSLRMVIGASIDKAKFRFFFIDGLDECAVHQSGDQSTQERQSINITGAINPLASIPNTKTCVSSRPWRAFVKCFGDPRAAASTLYMRDTSYHDGRKYAQAETTSAKTIQIDMILSQPGQAQVQRAKLLGGWNTSKVESLSRYQLTAIQKS